MLYMVVTLEVSKLSGWLNADANCRESKGGHTVRGEVRPGRAADDRGASRVQEGLDCRLGAGHGEERTRNRLPIFVTLEVSKLSGWLNADADCRETEGGHIVLGELRAGGREGGGRRGCKQRAGERSTVDWGQGTHEEHPVHGCDAGRVESQRLVERRRILRTQNM